MPKWADYAASKVRYNDKRTHITKLMVHEDKGDTLDNPTEWTREQVVSALGRGTTFVTALAGSEGKLTRGQDIHTVTVDRTEYIRTDRNSTGADNLENLPEF